MIDRINHMSTGVETLNQTYGKFTEYLRETKNLESISDLLTWDMEVIMPSGASAARGNQAKAQAGIVHDKLTDLKYGEMIEYLYKSQDKLEEHEQRNVGLAKKSYDQEVKVSKELAQKKAGLVIHAHEIWLKARKENDWNIFAPILEEWIELKKEICLKIDPMRPVYDTCIDKFEPGMTAERLSEIFDELKPHVIELITKIKEKEQIDDSWLTKGKFDIEKQKTFNHKLVQDLGFDMNCGRLDTSVHPMTVIINPSDVRITTKYDESNLIFALTSTVHETGHGLYEQGLDKRYENLPVSFPLSMGTHESQSLLWERMCGLSENFLNYYYPELQKLFGLTKTAKDFYRSCNVVRPSLIRIKADELTYIMHIIIRFEIERDLFNQTIRAVDVPDQWRQKMQQYLGIDVPDDKQGALQDVHWSCGYFGYFPTYTLGAIFACQYFNAAKKEMPLDEMIRSGNFKPLKQWLNTNIHQKGSLPKTSEQLLEEVTSERINIMMYCDYLKEKFGKIYDLQ